ncbi:MAG: hypothetical protein BWY25_03000 [Chloroflexi bacterium ADurb.Bin222]|nr:MAG: hypothetical protein BWY25_03000 [Chloroflexi bacterium ADurb.Bin222]
MWAEHASKAPGVRLRFKRCRPLREAQAWETAGALPPKPGISLLVTPSGKRRWRFRRVTPHEWCILLHRHNPVTSPEREPLTAKTAGVVTPAGHCFAPHPPSWLGPLIYAPLTPWARGCMKLYPHYRGSRGSVNFLRSHVITFLRSHVPAFPHSCNSWQSSTTFPRYHVITFQPFPIRAIRAIRG